MHEINDFPLLKNIKNYNRGSIIPEIKLQAQEGESKIKKILIWILYIAYI